VKIFKKFIDQKEKNLLLMIKKPDEDLKEDLVSLITSYERLEDNQHILLPFFVN